MRNEHRLNAQLQVLQDAERGLIEQTTQANNCITGILEQIARALAQVSVLEAQVSVLENIENTGELPTMRLPWLLQLTLMRSDDVAFSTELTKMRSSRSAAIGAHRLEIAALETKIAALKAEITAIKSEIAAVEIAKVDDEFRKRSVFPIFSPPVLKVCYRLQETIRSHVSWMATPFQADEKLKPWLLFRGPSGSGKTVAATHEVRKALDDLEVRQTTIFRVLPAGIPGLSITDEDKKQRNDNAIAFLRNLIPQGDNTSSLVLVFDECTTNIDLMRGIVASHVEARELASTMRYKHLLVVFAGIALPSALIGSIVNTNAQIVETIELHTRNEDFFMDVLMKNTKLSETTCGVLRGNKSLRTVVRWCGRTIRALEKVFELCFSDAKELQDNPTVQMARIDDILSSFSDVADLISKHVTKMNGLANRDPAELKLLLRTCMDAAFLQYLPSDIDSTVLECCAFTCCVEKLDGPVKEFRVTMEPVYYRAACNVLDIPLLPAVMSWQDFESVALTVLCGRLRAMRTILRKTRASSRDLFRGFFISSSLTHSDFEVPEGDVNVQQLLTPVSSEASINTLKRANGSSFNIVTPAAVVNGEKAVFGDGILLLNGLVVITQAKFGLNPDLAGNNSVGFGNSEESIPWEYAKAGFPTADYGNCKIHENKFGLQRKLLCHLMDLCKSSTAVFLLFTNKPVSHRLKLNTVVKGQTILVHAHNIDDCLSPVASCGFSIHPVQ